MTPRLYASALAICAIGLAACAGSGVTPRTNTPSARSAPDRSLGSDSKIGGVVETDDFAIKSGKHVTVDKDLFVFASKSIRIDGMLQVPSQHVVAFFTPDFELNGSIETSGPYVERPGDHLLNACSVVLASNARWEIAPGADFEISSPSGKSADKCRVQIQSGVTIAMATAAPGGTFKNDKDGQLGGSIEIGSDKAISETERFAKAHGHGRLKATEPDVLNLSSVLRAGGGGMGQSDPIGRVDGSEYVYDPGFGVRGGDVNVSVGKITGSNPTMFGGDGGNGGTIGQQNSYNNNPMSGTAASPNALNVIVMVGGGGWGGSVIISGHKPSDLTTTGGNGGNASLITSAVTYESFWAGDGYSAVVPTTTTSGNGSSLQLEIALPGQAGRGTSFTAKDGQFYPVTIGGGRGGAPTSAMTLPAPGTVAAGGAGGNLTLLVPPHTGLNTLVTQFKLHVISGGFGSGGDSREWGTQTSICPSPPPAGVNGGAAGHYSDDGLLPVMFPGLSGWGFGFSGGAGSYGNPAGKGAVSGTDDEGHYLGNNGLDGTLCT